MINAYILKLRKIKSLSRQIRDAEQEIPILANQLREFNMEMDAICTKRADLWEVASEK